MDKLHFVTEKKGIVRCRMPAGVAPRTAGAPPGPNPSLLEEGVRPNGPLSPEKILAAVRMCVCGGLSRNAHRLGCPPPRAPWGRPVLAEPAPSCRAGAAGPPSEARTVPH